MDNQTNQPQTAKPKGQTQQHGAHAGTHRGSCEYNDGGYLSHYGGNDDYSNRNNETDSNEDGDFDGKVAYGNDNEVSEDEDEYGKYHSGL